jgi:hypothetical protein
VSLIRNKPRSKSIGVYGKIEKAGGVGKIIYNRSKS